MMIKTADDRIAYYCRKYDAFLRMRGRCKIRRALRLLRYKSLLFRFLESDKLREVAV